jgi:hypothetical protein
MNRPAGPAAFAVPAVALGLLLSTSPLGAQFVAQGGKLTGSGAVGAAHQGASVAVSADGNTLIVGGPQDNGSTGAAWVFTRAGGVWTMQARLVASDAIGPAAQGTSVGLSADGNTAIVGGPADDGYVGAAWVWARSGGLWRRQGAKLVGAGAAGSARQGSAIALSADGGTAAIGGPFDSFLEGAVWVFTRSGTTWTQQGPKLVGSFTPPVTQTGQARQGYAVALSADGDTLVFGGPDADAMTGAAWVFARSHGVWLQQGPRLVGTGTAGEAGQGQSVALSGDGDTALVGGPADGANRGSAWVFTRSAGVWTQQGARLVGTGHTGDSLLGRSVALSAFGNVALVGGPGDDANTGAAWIFTRSKGTWKQLGTKLVGAGAAGSATQAVAAALSLDGNTALLGGPPDASGAGAAWVFVNPAPPAASQLAFVQPPTDTVAGQPIRPPVTLQLLAGDDSPVARPDVNVTVGLSSGTGTLAGTLTRGTDFLGRAAFDDLVVDLSGTKRLLATGTGTSAVVSDPFEITSVTRLLPVVLDVASGSAHFVTEMALTNTSPAAVPVSMLYTASLGSKEGSGTVADSLQPGEQRRIADVLSYLRGKGLAIPPSAAQPQQGGTLLVTFQAAGAADPRLFSATARTASLTTAPQPAGRAGLAYPGLLPGESVTTSATIFGLRSTGSDRTNVAVFNMSSDPVTLRITVFSGAGDGVSVVFRSGETLPPWGWLQYGSREILDGTGIAQGWVTIERTSATGSFGAYAVVNDNETNDGSFVTPTEATAAANGVTVPVLVETSAFRSELTIANRSGSTATLTLSYVESNSPAFGPGGTAVVQLAPFEEQIIPEAIDWLRSHGVFVGPRDAAPYAGSLRISVAGTTAENVYAGARTASPSPAGGQFGLFTPGVYSGQEASAEATLFGLWADAENRTNVAVVNAGSDGAGTVVLQLQAYDGDAGGAPRGDALPVSLAPGQWAQPADFFRSSGVANGWVRVTRLSGTAPWIAYGVVNDGSRSGERTGDGAYVPMTK